MPKFSVPMKMVKSGRVVVEAESEDEAAELCKPPQGREVQEAMVDVDWDFDGYETDYTWGIEQVNDV